MYILTVGVSTS